MAKRLVTYRTDRIDSNSCFYGAPGPNLLFYRPKGKKSTVFPTADKGVWVECHPKYRNSKKVAKEKGFCMGGDYGVIRIPRYAVKITMDIGSFGTLEVYDRIDKFVTSIAESRIQEVNQSGDLLISYGDVKFTHIEKKSYDVQFNVGMLLNVLHIRSVPRPYVQKSFIWEV